MSDPPVKYNAAFAKGQGLQEETIALLQAWSPGMTAAELTMIALQQGLLRRATEKRTRDIISNHIAPRYLKNDARPAQYLHILIKNDFSSAALNQLFYIYTCRANPILRDFIGQVYWTSFAAGRTAIIKEQALAFIDGAVQNGHIAAPWSAELRDRIARGLMTCLADFDLAQKGRALSRKIVSFRPFPSTIFFLAHELHFAGMSDHQIMAHPDWQLFGLQPLEVVQELSRLSPHMLIVQFAGDLLRITWSCATMEEALRAITRQEF